VEHVGSVGEVFAIGGVQLNYKTLCMPLCGEVLFDVYYVII
jgi:hypothetical protein